MFSTLAKVNYLAILVCLCFVFACSDDDSTSPETNILVGEYVGVILESGYDVPSDIALGEIGYIGETIPIAVTNDLLLILNEDNIYTDEDTVQLVDNGDSTYTGAFQESDETGTIAFNFTITGNDALTEWQITIDIELDSNNDDIVDDTGAITVALQDRLDWSDYAGDWHYTVPYIDPNSGFVELSIETVEIEADGKIYGLTFYDDGDTLRARQYIEDDEEVLSLVIKEIGTDYMRFYALDKELPSTNTLPDPDDWVTNTGYSDVHGIPVSRLADFEADEDTITVVAQNDVDTDGQDAGGGYFYFGANLVSVDIIFTINDDGTVDAAMGDDGETRDWGYMELSGVGYAVSPRIETAGNDLDVNYMVLELDASGVVTGNGLMQGYDIPDHDTDGEIDDDEALNIDNEGIAVLGDGLDPTLFEFITTTIPSL